MLTYNVVVAWRRASRDWLYTILNLLGLTIGLAALILIALYIRYEMNYDDFLDHRDQIYRIATRFDSPGRPASWFARVPQHIAGALKLDFPEFSEIARLSPSRVGVRHDATEYAEAVYWADPDILDVLGLRMIAGNAVTALERPDSVVLTRTMAWKYFGRDAPLGETLTFDRSSAMHVTAVIDDIPANSHLTLGILASGRAALSVLAKEDAETMQPGSVSFTGYLYGRLKPGVTAGSLSDRLSAFVTRYFSNPDGSTFFGLQLDPVTSLHLLPYNGDMKDHANPDSLAAIGLIGAVIVLVASINFINLTTARAARRAIEIGIRKASGATRLQLVGYILGETFALVAIATVLALALVEIVLPKFNAFSASEISIAYGHDWTLDIGLLAVMVAVGLTSGLYPALVLSGFRPAAVLKASRVGFSGARLRHALVIMQFSVSIALAVATIVIHRQTDFATGRALRFQTDNVVLVRGMPACGEAFRNQVKALAGVRDAVCSLDAPAGFSKAGGTADLPDGRQVNVDLVNVDARFTTFYGLPTLAGRMFEDGRGADIVAAGNESVMDAAIIVNESAVRALGLTRSEDAIGKSVTISGVRPGARPSQIIGVVPDFPIGSIREIVKPSVFYMDPSAWNLLSVKLNGSGISETLSDIDRLWFETGAVAPVQRLFLDRVINTQYDDIKLAGQLFTGFTALAIVIGCLGLFGLSAFAAQTRTKEIGIRKALGASGLDIVRLMIWQFTRPVIIATIIACPAIWWLANRWLDGFAYRIDLDWVPFAIAGSGALLIAVATTGGHAVWIARTVPAAALRYE
jgi:putative ABC transport system permease protein